MASVAPATSEEDPMTTEIDASQAVSNIQDKLQLPGLVRFGMTICPQLKLTQYQRQIMMTPPLTADSELAYWKGH